MSSQSSSTQSRPKRFVDKVVIVTGASAGIGADAAVEFGREGATLVIHGQNAGRLEKTAQEAIKAGVPVGKVLQVVGSMEDQSTPEKIVKATIEKFGKIDVLVNNAGATGKLDKWEYNSMESCDFLYAVNFRAVAALTQLAMPYLIKSKGNVINVTSISAQCAFPTDDIFYCSMKAALDHYTRVMANIVGPKGVRVNALAPGPVETMILDPERGIKSSASEGLSKWAEHATLLQRVGHVSEMSSVLKFLASDEASYVTGAVWLADGGAVVKGSAP